MSCVNGRTQLDFGQQRFFQSAAQMARTNADFGGINFEAMILCYLCGSSNSSSLVSN